MLYVTVWQLFRKNQHPFAIQKYVSDELFIKKALDYVDIDIELAEIFLPSFLSKTLHISGEMMYFLVYGVCASFFR